MDPWSIITEPSGAAQLSFDSTIAYLEEVNTFFETRAEPLLVNLPAVEKDYTGNSIEPKLAIIGDTHGDYITTQSAVNEFFFESRSSEQDQFVPKPGSHLLFIGDYIDRSPSHCPNGSFNNILFVIALKLQYPDQVTVLRGNHESYDVIPCPPFDFPDELYELFGEQSGKVLDQFSNIFSKLPLMFRTENGLLASHGGIFRQQKTTDEIQDLDRNSLEALGVLTWSEPREFCRPRAGIVGEMYNFYENEYRNTMKSMGVNVMVRGHTPALAARTIYNNSCLTVFTTSTFNNLMGDRSCGVVTLSLAEPVNSVSDLSLYLLSRGNWLPVEAKPMEIL